MAYLRLRHSLQICHGTQCPSNATSVGSAGSLHLFVMTHMQDLFTEAVSVFPKRHSIVLSENILNWHSKNKECQLHFVAGLRWRRVRGCSTNQRDGGSSCVSDPSGPWVLAPWWRWPARVMRRSCWELMELDLGGAQKRKEEKVKVKRIDNESMRI